MVEIDSRVKKRIFNLFGCNLIVWVWFLLKKVIIRFFYLKKSMMIERMLMIVSCRIFVGLIVRILFRMMVWMFMDVGFNDIINSFRLKKEEKIRLMMVFFFKWVCWLRNSMLFVVSLLEKKVFRENGSFSIYVFVIFGIIECDSVLLISD